LIVEGEFARGAVYAGVDGAEEQVGSGLGDDADEVAASATAGGGGGEGEQEAARDAGTAEGGGTRRG
jgi:hypothetical protein